MTFTLRWWPVLWSQGHVLWTTWRYILNISLRKYWLIAPQIHTTPASLSLLAYMHISNTYNTKTNFTQIRMFKNSWLESQCEPPSPLSLVWLMWAGVQCEHLSWPRTRSPLISWADDSGDASPGSGSGRSPESPGPSWSVTSLQSHVEQHLDTWHVRPWKFGSWHNNLKWQHLPLKPSFCCQFTISSLQSCI